MDGEAIKRIAELVTQAQVNEHLVNSGYPCVVTPEGSKFSSIESYGAAPLRYRGQFYTTSMDHYLLYCGQHLAEQPDNSATFVDPDEMRAHTIFDLGTPGNPMWGSHTATLALEKTEPYRALLDKHGRMLSQSDFIDYIEDWAPYLTFNDDVGKEVSLANALGMLRRLTVTKREKKESHIHEMRGERSELEEVEINSTAGVIPTNVNLTADCYGLNTSIRIECRIRANVDVKGGKEPIIGLRIIGKERIKQRLSMQFHEKLSKSFPDSSKLYIGIMKVPHGR